jgi:hypothetical protein
MCEGSSPTAATAPRQESFELCRHKEAQKMRAKSWHGYYWAKQNEQGNYEIRSVFSSLGEHSVPGGIMPKESFEEHYEKADLPTCG